ncbi:MAG: hypothetical protein SH818_06430 [Saprospiraceae bacterium]|nr:hypothetical protein [Saprospiraceae bacterium]
MHPNNQVPDERIVPLKIEPSSTTLVICLLILLTQGCQPNKPAGMSYETIDLKSTEQKLVTKLDSLGNKLVEGTLWQNKRNGSWVTYYPGGQMQTITNYIEGKKNGIYIKMGTDNRIEEFGAYEDDLLEGPFTRYLYGFKDETLEFHKGKKNGWAKKYYMGGGIQREMQYKDDVENGLYRFYGEDGLKMIEETFKDGKKTGGGIVLEQ